MPVIVDPLIPPPPRPYLLTASGIRVDLVNPRAEDVSILDVAHALARICRYTGHCAEAYSVAQHSCLVACELEGQGYDAATCRQGLLHDAHEAYTGDMASPIKRALRRLGTMAVAAFDPWEHFERRHASAVRDRFRIPRDLHAAVHAADLALLMAEKRDLMPPDGPDGGGWPCVEPSKIQVVPWTADFAQGRFLDLAGVLGGL